MPSRSAKQPRHGYRDIVSVLRGKILTGDYAAGDRLPTRQQLQRQFRTTKVTLQSALDVLAEDGFVQARGRRGTFVVDQPPHLNEYALIFHYDPSDLAEGGWSHFYAVLANEATKIQETSHRRLECFYGINERRDSANYLRLVSKLEAHQFAGLIFAGAPHCLRGTPLVERAGIPRVALMPRDPTFPMIAAVLTKPVAWFEKALDYLASRGRRRVAFVRKAAPKSILNLNVLAALLASRGLTTRPYWNLPLPVWSEGAEQIVHLLLRSEGERPDALVITDDNLVEPVLAALLAAGRRVPEDLEVVAHANFPRSGPQLVPLKWLGYDNHLILETCLAIIDRQGRGEKSPSVTTIAPVFEAELASNPAAVERAGSGPAPQR